MPNIPTTFIIQFIIKACVNGTMNGLCTILDVNMAGLGATKPAHDMVVTIVNEFAAVAAKEQRQLRHSRSNRTCRNLF